MKQILVYIDGFLLQVNIDYQVVSNMVMFKQAPPRGSQVQITDGSLSGSTRYVSYQGDGARVVFSTPEQSEFNDLIDDLATYRDHPTVADVVERLKVVLALVKQDALSID